MSIATAIEGPVRRGILAAALLVGANQSRAEFPAGAPAQDAGSLFDEAFFLRLGFSFIVGLAVGYALKIAFKIALVVIGVILVGVFALQYWGLVNVNWTGMEGHYDELADSVSTQGSAFFDFVKNNLSNGVSFLAGLAVGLRL